MLITLKTVTKHKILNTVGLYKGEEKVKLLLLCKHILLRKRGIKINFQEKRKIFMFQTNKYIKIKKNLYFFGNENVLS